MNKHKIGIIGYGFVGKAVYAGFKEVADIQIYDKYQNIGVELEELVQNSEMIFVCVPTPMNEDGSCDTTIVEQVVKEAASCAPAGERKIFIVKSTVPPGTCANLVYEVSSHAVIFNPEFLTERNAIKDFMEQPYVILGRTSTTKDEDLDLVTSLYKKLNAMGSLDSLPVYRCQSEEAEMLKYATNGFLATKVTFFNEIYNICKVNDIDYEEVLDLLNLDKRIGKTHMQVPGPDGHYGFSGHCFPKDLNGLIAYAKRYNGYYPRLLKQIWESNKDFRPNEDWKERVGATTANSYKQKEPVCDSEVKLGTGKIDPEKVREAGERARAKFKSKNESLYDIANRIDSSMLENKFKKTADKAFDVTLNMFDKALENANKTLKNLKNKKEHK